jgi:hypothetical protein
MNFEETGNFIIPPPTGLKHKFGGGGTGITLEI